LSLLKIQGFSYLYKSTKTGCGFIGDFSYLLFFFTENEGVAQKQSYETRQIKTMSGGEETPVGVAAERLTPGVNRQI